MLTSCSSSSTEETVYDNNETSTDNNADWKYFEEIPYVPTPDSCVDDVTFATELDHEGNKVYCYYTSSEKDAAEEQYNQYIDILENECSFQIVTKPGAAIARKNDESLLGVGLGGTKKGSLFLEVMIFTDKQTSSSDEDYESSPDYSSDSNQNRTLGEEQALKKALDYLDYTAFSYSGLVEQLEFEGFSHSEAVYGADNCGADWNEQAARKAKDYLDYSSFSRDGLISQLEYEGFTSSQAEYGAAAVGY